ncbi:MAG: hypothetical protein IPP99_05820 [Chitinophagaceae bacterium]|nr:hypothetical protein [Chitinophagaceae bacterium]
MEISDALGILINVMHELPISTHELKLVQELFQRTIVINDSNIVADGLTIEILENEDLLMTKYTQQKRTVRFIDRFSL